MNLFKNPLLWVAFQAVGIIFATFSLERNDRDGVRFGHLIVAVCMIALVLILS